MIKIAALNEESEEDSDSEEEVTREALEQIALQQYAKALDLQRKGNLTEAMQLLKDLLETELLDEVKKPAPGEKPTEPLFNLKYLCFKNVASMQSSVGEVGNAIESYSAAAELDNSDVTLWHRLGMLCLQAHEYERALYAFQSGSQRNPRYWPCLDNILTLQMALGYYNDCMSTIYTALQLDPGYLRGLVYRKHIYTNFPYIKEFLVYLDSKYKYDGADDNLIDEQKAEKLLNEANDINKLYMEHLNVDDVKCFQPQLKLKKQITHPSWHSVGESLIHMHKYMSENYFSHACIIEIGLEQTDQEDAMDVCEDPIRTEMTAIKIPDNEMEVDKNIENILEDNSEQIVTDTDKVESDLDTTVGEITSDSSQVLATENKESKKTTNRRRGSALKLLEQWVWCTNRRSGRKKTVNKPDEVDDNVYATLRRMVPKWLIPGSSKKSELAIRDTSLDTIDLYKLFDDKPNVDNTLTNENLEYFGSDAEQRDVKEYIEKFSNSKCDIIELLKEFLKFLAHKWQTKWPKDLWTTFVEANKCYNNHIDIPSCTDNNREELLHYIFVNILSEEFITNNALKSSSEDKQCLQLNVIETIGIVINAKPNIFGTDCLELMLRYLWVKLHVYLMNKCDELALDCLYQLVQEFKAIGDANSPYCLNIINFTFKPNINESEVTAYIKFLERNKQLSTVLELYNGGNYEDVLQIVIDSFEHCKSIARKQEDEMSLHFAVQLALILDCYWALGKVDECFKWSITCLHEALKHYFLSNTGTSEVKKWSLTILKVLSCIEHIFSNEGLLCLDSLSQEELSNCLEDLIRIIGHQVETTASEMPFSTVLPWIIMYYILQREDDQGRSRRFIDKNVVASDEIPSPLMVLFVGHEQLGQHGWCCNNDGKLLYFILDTVVPRLRSPSLSRSLEQVCQYMEQCVFCLFGHPSKKTKLKYLIDHNVSPQSLGWDKAQQIYEIFRPLTLPEVEGKAPAISADTDQLFHRIIALIPPESEPQKYLLDMEKYINGKIDKLPLIPPLLPYKMKDIYFLVADYYFKKEEGKMSVKYNMFDIIVNNDRCESWAEIALAKAMNLELKLNSCININNEKDFLGPARAVIRCFQRALELDTLHCNLWIEYGVFSYGVYSFCSRLLKQASESLSMNDFDSLEKEKEEMLGTTQKCFTTVIKDVLNNSHESDKLNDDMWLHYYMMGKVAEKKNKPPAVYFDYYVKSIRSLKEADAFYPPKINYKTPQHLSIEVLELHYRMHASILKYIEQHENKPIPMAVGKIFINCIKEWNNGPYAKKNLKNAGSETENDATPAEVNHQAANILKRSISDAGEEDNHEAKRLKLESAAAKVRRSASYDTERITSNEVSDNLMESSDNINVNNKANVNDSKMTEHTNENNLKVTDDNKMETKDLLTNGKIDKDVVEKPQILKSDKKDETSSGASSTNSSSDSSSDDSTSDSSSDSSRDSDTSNKCKNDINPISNEEIMSIVSACLDALEDCTVRFPQHYKAIYRLAHYHFYYKKGKDIERCRDLMLSNFTSRSNQRLPGLFCERKQTNFFNGVWRIPLGEVDRPGGFSYHMNRCVLLTMEILKEIDDHKTLLDLSLHLQRVPEPDKKYLRDSDREDLAQQAFSLCVQSLKGQLVKFSQQGDLKSNDVEKQALNSLMLDIYRAYLRAQKQPNSKQFTTLLVDAYKLVTTTPISENANFVDISMRHCQTLIAALKQKATLASIDKGIQNAHKKQTIKAMETVKTMSLATQPKVDSTTNSMSGNKLISTVIKNTNTINKNIPTVNKSSATSMLNKNNSTMNKNPTISNKSHSLPSMTAHEMSKALQNYMLKEPLLSQQTAAALSLSYLSALTGYSFQNTLQPSMQNALQTEIYKQFIAANYTSFTAPQSKKQAKSSNATTKSLNSATINSQAKGLTRSLSVPSATHSSMLKGTQTTVIANISKTINNKTSGSASSLNPSSSNGTCVQPAHMPSTSQVTHANGTQPAQAHKPNTSTIITAADGKLPLPHQQVSPGKTLQEKLAERQKNHPVKPTMDVTTSLNRLPSSLTVTKTVGKSSQMKKPEVKKALSYNDSEIIRPKPTVTSDEIIVLDDDD